MPAPLEIISIGNLLDIRILADPQLTLPTISNNTYFEKPVKLPEVLKLIFDK
jgi:hypothetical protein